MKPTNERLQEREISAVLEKKEVDLSEEIEVGTSRMQIKAILREDVPPENFVYPERFMM